MGRCEDAVEAVNFWDILAVILSASISAMGLGGGGVLILYLTLIKSVPQLEAQGINLLFFIPCAVAAVFIYAKRRVLQPKIILPMVLGGLVGVATGSFLLYRIDTKYISILFACFLIVVGSITLFGKSKKA